jgi:hypothetical protein
MKARLVIEYTHALVALEECRIHPGSAHEKLQEALARILERPLPAQGDPAVSELSAARQAIVDLIENELDAPGPNFAGIERASAQITKLAREAARDA